MHLSAIDTNLFVVVRALLDTRSVTQAARRLGLSQSATSHALGRARELFGDPLFVRAGRNLVPTPRATAIREAIIAGLEQLEASLVSPDALDPARLERAFRVETTDHVQFVLLRAIDRLVRAEGPRVDVYLQSLQPDTFGRLRGGALDLGISVYATVDPDLEQQVLFEDKLVAVVRRDHPALGRKISIAKFAALPHLLVAPSGTATGLVDRLLAEHGLTRRIARTSSTFLDMAFLVAETDYVVSLPESLARPLLTRLGLTVLPIPITLPSFTHSMIWHRRHTADPEHAWFRELVVRAWGEAAAPAPRRAAPTRRRRRR